jgi:hypothetical protein
MGSPPGLFFELVYFLKSAIFLRVATARKLGRLADARRSRARDRRRRAECRRRNGKSAIISGELARDAGDVFRVQRYCDRAGMGGPDFCVKVFRLQ